VLLFAQELSYLEKSTLVTIIVTFPSGVVLIVLKANNRFQQEGSMTLHLLQRVRRVNVLISHKSNTLIMLSGLSHTLRTYNFKLGRLQTGTPARLDGRSVNFTALEKQDGDVNPQPFSYLTTNIPNKVGV
jgi:hypothetical protein